MLYNTYISIYLLLSKLNQGFKLWNSERCSWGPTSCNWAWREEAVPPTGLSFAISTDRALPQQYQNCTSSLATGRECAPATKTLAALKSVGAVRSVCDHCVITV